MPFLRAAFLVVLTLAVFGLWNPVAHAGNPEMGLEQAVAQAKRSAAVLKKHPKLRKEITRLESQIAQARRTSLARISHR